MELGDSRDITAVIASLQASQIAQTTMLQSLIASHPNPDALKAQWVSLVPARAASALQAKVSGKPGHVTNEFLIQAFQDWTGHLEKYSKRD